MGLTLGIILLITFFAFIVYAIRSSNLMRDLFVIALL